MAAKASTKAPAKTSTKRARKSNAGRPRKEIDIKLATGLAQMLCTAEEIAGVFGVSVDTLDNRLKEEGWANFSAFRDKFAAEGKASLRRMQWAKAKSGNTTMQIWLGRQYLGQTERREITGADGGPVQTEMTVSHKRYEDMTREELEAEINARSAST